ncbi:hypothetical protein QP157_20575 [Sphingomonas sp. LR61]
MPEGDPVRAVPELEPGQRSGDRFVDVHQALVGGDPGGEHADALGRGVDLLAHVGRPAVLGDVVRGAATGADVQAVGAEAGVVDVPDDRVEDAGRGGHTAILSRGTTLVPPCPSREKGAEPRALVLYSS